MWRRILVGSLVLAGLAAIVPAANAATTNQTGICSKGNYGSYLTFPSRGNQATYVAEPGRCRSYSFVGGGTETVYVFGIASGGAVVFLGSRTIRRDEHNVFRTYGSIPGARRYTFAHQ